MKKSLLIVLGLFAFLFASAQIPSSIPTLGLVGYWPMGDTNRNFASNNHHATLVNTVLGTDRFGNQNKASVFTGNSFGTIPSTAMAAVSGSFTVSVWVTADTIIPATNGHHIIDDRASNDWSFRFRLGHSYSPSTLFNVDSAYADRIFGNNQRVRMPKPTTEGWFHYVFVYEVGFPSLIRAYYNGTLMGSVVANGVVPGSRALNIGRTFYPGAPLNGDGFHRGKIDDIGLWNRALSATEIMDIYSSCNVNLSATPVPQTINAGSTTQFSVSGPNIQAYQWQMDTGLVSNFVAIPNGTNFQGVDSSVLLVINAPRALNGARFRCLILDSACAVTTSPVSLTVNCGSLTATQPQNTSRVPGDSAVFTVGAARINHTYQWQIRQGMSWSNLADFGSFFGTTTNRLVVRNVNNSNHNQQFRCLTQSWGCTDTSEVAAINVLCLARNLNGPTNASVIEAQTAVFRVDSLAAATYTWQRNVGFGFQNLANGGNVQGVNEPTLRISNTQWADNNTGYRCIVRVDHCADTSGAALLLIVGGVSVHENQKEPWKIYPNPAKEAFYLERESNSLNVTPLQVRNALGQVILQLEVSDRLVKLPTAGWAEGIYLVEFGGRTQRLLIAR